LSRIFISHSSKDDREAIALKRWLVLHDRRLRDEIFLDLDRHGGIPAGVRWKDALKQANSRCEAVICLLSSNWEASAECQTEFRMAETLNKRIFIARLEPSTGMGITREWQWLDLFGVGPRTEIDIGDGHGEPVVFATHGLARLRDGLGQAGIGADLFDWPPAGDEDREPYRGWEPFQESDAAVYFGRDAEIIRGLDALRGMRKSGVETMFVVLGPSGAGKSSFLRAGLLPRLRRDDRSFFLLDPVRPERNVLTGDTGLARAISTTRARLGLSRPQLWLIKNACLDDADVVHEPLAETQRAVVETFIERPEPLVLPTLVIPVDQAEELVSADAGPEAVRFMQLIKQYAESDSATKASLIVALTIRTDHYESLQTSPALTGVKSVVFDDLKPMPDGQFREVIVGPAVRATEGGRRLRVDPALVGQLLADCKEGADTLPLLSLTLARLYAEYGDDGELTLADYRAMGEMSKVVHTEIDGILSHDVDTRAKELLLLRAAFVPWLATINPDNDQAVRRVARWDDLPSDSKPLLDKFVRKRLLVKDKRPGGDVIEVALESLLRQWEELKEWLEEERENLKHADALERAAADWAANARNDAWLLDGQRIADAETLMARAGFQDRLAGAKEFVDSSAERAGRRAEADRLRQEADRLRQEEEARHVEQARKRKRRLLAALAAATVVVLVGAFVIAQATHEKGLQAQRNTAWRLFSEAEQMLQGARAGGDVRALQQVLTADRLGVPAAEGLANSRRDELKIIETPMRNGGVTPVKSVSVSQDGRLIASAANDSKVRIWDAQSGAQVREIQVADSHPVFSVAFSPDGKLVATGSGQQHMEVFDVESGTQVGRGTDGAAVESVAFDRGGGRIATAADDGQVRIFAATTGAELHPLEKKADSITRTVAFHPDGRFVAAGSDDGAVRMWDVDSGQMVHDTPPQAGSITSVAFDEPGSRLAVSRVDGTVQVFDGRDLHQLGSFVAHPNSVSAVQFSPDGSRIATSSTDNTIRVWDARSPYTPIGAPFTGNHGDVASIVFDKSGTRIVSGGADGSIRVWDAVAGLPIPSGQREVRAAAFSPDGHVIASAGMDGTVKLWDAGKGTWIRTFGQPTPSGRLTAVTSLAFDDHGRWLVTGANDGSVRLWDMATGAPTDLRPALPPGPNGLAVDKTIVKAVAFSSKGVIAAAGNEGTIWLWATDPIRPLGEQTATAVNENGKTVNYPIWTLGFSPDGSKLVTGAGGDNNYLQLWDVDGLKPDGSPMVGHAGFALYTSPFSPDGAQIVTGGYDGFIRAWNAQTHQPGPVLSPDQNPVLTAGFSHDGKWLVTGGTDGRVRLWDAKDNFQPVGLPLGGHRDWVSTVAFSPDDSMILSSGYDGDLQLWAAPKPLQTVLCDKLNSNMSQKQWNDWVSPDIDYIPVCDGLPMATDPPN
jgi:WD40 repeat protein